MAGRLTLLLAAGARAGRSARSRATASAQQKASDRRRGSARSQAKIAQSSTRLARSARRSARSPDQIHTLEAQVGDVSSRLDVAAVGPRAPPGAPRQAEQLFKLQTQRLSYLKHEYTLSVQRLNARLVAIYKEEDPTTIDVILTAKSFQRRARPARLSQRDRDAGQAGRRAGRDGEATGEGRAARARRRCAHGVANEARAINARVQQAAILRGELLASQDKLAGARASKSHALVAHEGADRGRGRGVEGARRRERPARREDPGSAGSRPLVASVAGRRLVVAVETRRRASSGRSAARSRARSACAGGRCIRGSTSASRAGTPIHAAAAGNGDLLRLDVGLRQPRDDRPRRRPRDRLRHTSRAIAVVVRRVGDAGPGDRLLGLAPASAPGPHVHFEVRVNGAARRSARLL